VFEFSMKAYKYYREGYIEIKMQYRFNDYEDWVTITEIVPRERFLEDSKYAERVIDNLFDRSRREVKNSMDDLIKKGAI